MDTLIRTIEKDYKIDFGVSAKRIFQIILASLLFLSVAIFVIQIIHPAPYWKNICNGSCNMEEQEILTNKILAYGKDLKNILYGISFVSMVVFFILIKKENKKKYTFFTLSLIALLFGVFSNFIYKLYFGYGTIPTVLTSVITIIGLAASGYWLLSKKIKNSEV